MDKTQKKKLRKRIETDEGYERVRENMSEFGRSGKASKLLRNSLRTLIKYASDRYTLSRLVKEMSKVIKADTVSARGERTLANGDLQLLKGFEFNEGATLSSIFFAQYTSTIDRATGTLKIDIPAFVPKDTINVPPATTHFKLMSAASEVDFTANSFNAAVTGTAEIAYGKQTEAAVSLSHTLTANSKQPLFLVLSIRFYQLVNGVFYELYTDKVNAAALVQIDTVAATPPPGE